MITLLCGLIALAVIVRLGIFLNHYAGAQAAHFAEVQASERVAAALTDPALATTLEWTRLDDQQLTRYLNEIASR